MVIRKRGSGKRVASGIESPTQLGPSVLECCRLERGTGRSALEGIVHDENLGLKLVRQIHPRHLHTSVHPAHHIISRGYCAALVVLWGYVLVVSETQPVPSAFKAIFVG